MYLCLINYSMMMICTSWLHKWTLISVYQVPMPAIFRMYLKYKYIRRKIGGNSPTSSHGIHHSSIIPFADHHFAYSPHFLSTSIPRQYSHPAITLCSAHFHTIRRKHYRVTTSRKCRNGDISWQRWDRLKQYSGVLNSKRLFRYSDRLV